MNLKSIFKLPVNVIVFLFLIVILGLLVSACQPGEMASNITTGTSQPISICTSAESPLQLPVWYAYENGLFDRYDLQAEIVRLPNGSTAATTMLAGEVDACQIAASNIVNAAMAGEDLVLIGGLFNTHVYSLMVSPDINDAADLVGKSVAVTRPGTATYTSLIIGLQHLGLEPDKDVAIIAVGSHADIMGALTSGAVDGAIQGVPLSFKSKDAGFRELLNISNLRYPYQHLAIATSRKFLDERPEDGLNLMRAITDAVHEMQNDPEGSKKVLAQYLALDPAADADLLEATYQVVVKEQMEAVPNVSKEGVQAVIDIAAKDNPTASALDVEDVIDTRIMDTLKSTGFLESLER